MIWHGEELETTADLMSAMSTILDSGSTTIAEDFMAAAREQMGDADKSIGYVTGYFDHETGVKMRHMFGVEHPFIDHKEMPNPTVEQLLEAGMEQGRKMMGESGGNPAVDHSHDQDLPEQRIKDVHVLVVENENGGESIYGQMLDGVFCNFVCEDIERRKLLNIILKNQGTFQVAEQLGKRMFWRVYRADLDGVRDDPLHRQEDSL